MADSTMFGYNLGIPRLGMPLEAVSGVEEKEKAPLVPAEKGVEDEGSEGTPRTSEDYEDNIPTKIGGHFPTSREANATHKENFEFACGVLKDWFSTIRTPKDMARNVSLVTRCSVQMLCMHDNYLAEAIHAVCNNGGPMYRKGCFARDMLSFMLTVKKVHPMLENFFLSERLELPDDSKRMVVVDFLGDDNPTKIFKKAVTEGTTSSFSVYSLKKCNQQIKEWKKMGKREPLTWGKGQNLVAQAKRLKQVIENQFRYRADCEVLVMLKCSTMSSEYGFPFVSTFDLEMAMGLKRLNVEGPPSFLPFRFNMLRRFNFVKSVVGPDSYRDPTESLELDLSHEDKQLRFATDLLEEWFRRIRIQDDVFDYPPVASRLVNEVLTLGEHQYLAKAFEELMKKSEKKAMKFRKGSFSRDYMNFLLMAKEVQRLCDENWEVLRKKIPEGTKRLVVLDYKCEDNPDEVFQKEICKAKTNAKPFFCFSPEIINNLLGDPMFVGKRVECNLLKLGILTSFKDCDDGAVLIMHQDNILSVRHAFPFDATLPLQRRESARVA
ncbi:hypothetical protein A3770_02p13350 [Chloropicon primus]|uniref:Uncharacterized protein n=1 Tax=Chloropicon primus TaxID=1764295 RepID=A0A5B8MEL3_9CHLO|nr:hypothetical protein A3770_02p13350 [Chloropicon primus]|mmetsp:Transcript_5669/g.17186  ORF Transcript_5669/g.17186 Transcript_5669/m.17186 type:complete len:550 (-) Transcript_5669:1851-3500(-)|eukprot:QDZ18817.1 hypothetical protein A3770_02p13350 [Chloropicon primus]